MKVFISHSHKDESLAKKIAVVLKNAGLDVWDDREILPGDNWADKISQALNESNAMVVLLTSESLKSRSVRHDIEFALGEQRFNNRLLPVIVGSAEDTLFEKMPWILGRLKSVKLDEPVNDEDDLKQIAQALLNISPKSRTHKAY